MFRKCRHVGRPRRRDAIVAIVPTADAVVDRQPAESLQAEGMAGESSSSAAQALVILSQQSSDAAGVPCARTEKAPELLAIDHHPSHTFMPQMSSKSWHAKGSFRTFRKVGLPTQGTSASGLARPSAPPSTPPLPLSNVQRSPFTGTVGPSGLRIYKRKSSALSASEHTNDSSEACVCSVPSLAPTSRKTNSSLGSNGTDDDAVDVTTKMALMRSPSKGHAHALALLPTQTMKIPLLTSSTIVAHTVSASAKSFGNGTMLSEDSLAQVKLEQRGTHGLAYDASFFFPSKGSETGKTLSDSDKLDRTSIRRALRYICHGMHNCLCGDCLLALQEMDVYRFRTAAMRRIELERISLQDILVADLSPSLNRTADRWEPTRIALDDVTSHLVCPAAYGLLLGASGSTLKKALLHIKESPADASSIPVPHRIRGGPASAALEREQRSEDWCLLRSYVADLINKHEANPAPGAHQPGRITHINKSTWKAKWSDVQFYFRTAPRVPGSQSMLKKVWKLETRLKEKKACSHSKCDVCSGHDKKMDELRGVNTPEAVRDREYIRRAQVEHDKQHLGMRSQLDEAALEAYVSPADMWTVLADAATQRNFMLPKFKFRVPKKLAGRPFWGYKLMATYAYGYGFTPFLVHDSQYMGANLTWTVIWLTLCSMRKRYGKWPSVLHITLDNTTGENKNETTIAMCAWLVSSGKVKQVRLLFLLVGHTHVIIDHIFGVITVGLRRKELLTPQDLVQNIEGSLAENPQYMAKPVQTLYCLWDFKSWCKKEMKVDTSLARLFRGQVEDEHGSYHGMYDMIFNVVGSELARLKYREHVSHPWLPEASNGAITITALPREPPQLQEIKPWSKWSKDGTKSVTDTILYALEFARSLSESLNVVMVRSIWEQQYKLIPSVIDLLLPSLKLTFELLNDNGSDVLRLTAEAATTTGGNVADLSYEEWKRNNSNLRTEPLAIDPVLSSEQSQSDYDKARAAMQQTLRSGNVHPTIASGSALLSGDFILAAPTSTGGVELYSISSINGSRSPFATHLEFTAVQYEHTPNAEVAGMFGTFKMKMTLVGQKREQTRLLLNRSQVKVFNVDLDKKRRILSIRTLRALALVMPHYPFPARKDIPESHLNFLDDEDEDVGGPRARKRHQPAGGGRGGRSDNRPHGRRGGRGGRARGSGRSGTWNVSSDSSESAEDSSISSFNDGSDNSSAVDSSDEEQNVNLTHSSRAETSVPIPEARPADRCPPMLRLPAPAMDLKLDSLVLLNMRNDEEYINFTYPIALVYICSLEPLSARWFHIPLSQLAPKKGRRRKARDFLLKSAFLTFHKYWTHKNWWPKSKKQRPPLEEILKYWYQFGVSKHWILPIELPEYDAEKVRMNDTYKVSMDFVIKTIIPTCERENCQHFD